MLSIYTYISISISISIHTYKHTCIHTCIHKSIHFVRAYRCPCEPQRHNFFCIHSDTQGRYSDAHACTATHSSAMLTAEARWSEKICIRRDSCVYTGSDHASAMHMNAHMCITHIHAYRCIAHTATVCLCRLGGGTRPQ